MLPTLQSLIVAGFLGLLLVCSLLQRHARWAKAKLRLILAVGRWRCVCPDCNGTGICAHPHSLFPHSCDGECNRVRVPWELVPSNFDNGKYRDVTPDGTIIGSGWIWGSLWQMLRLGWWNHSTVKTLREMQERTFVKLKEFAPDQVALWHKQVIDGNLPQVEVPKTDLHAEINRIVGAWWDERLFATQKHLKPDIHMLISRLCEMVDHAQR